MYLFLDLRETALEGSVAKVKKVKPRREHNSEIAELLLVGDDSKRRCEIKDSGKKSPDLTKHGNSMRSSRGKTVCKSARSVRGRQQQRPAFPGAA